MLGCLDWASVFDEIITWANSNGYTIKRIHFGKHLIKDCGEIPDNRNNNLIQIEFSQWCYATERTEDVVV